MKIDELRKIKNQRPFVPFTIVTGDGGEVRINHPDALAWGEGENPRVAVAISGDDYHYIEVALITRVVVSSTQTA
jgi:hypothetical protein